MSTPMLSLKQFMIRQQVLQLYRRLLRGARQIPDPNYRQELLEWIRTDFRTNTLHTDEFTIKMLISHGQRSLKELENAIKLSK